MKTEDKTIFDQQVNFAVQKYSANRPPSLVRLEAIELATKAYEKFDPSKSNLKTHLSGALKKLMRASYKASNPLKTTEGRNIQKHRLSLFRDDFIDQNGVDPTARDVARAFSTTEKEASRMLVEGRTVRVESNYLGGSTPPPILTKREIIQSLDGTQDRSIANAMYQEGLSLSQYAQKSKISLNAASKRKSRLDKKIRGLQSSLVEEKYV